MKPVVTYQDAWTDIKEGYGVTLTGLSNHPAGLRGEVVLTSRVVKIISESEFETLNTHYIKAARKDEKNHRMD